MSNPYKGVQGSMRCVRRWTIRTLHGEQLAAFLLANEEHLADVAASKKLDLLEGSGSNLDL